MKTSIATVSISGDFAEKLSAIAAAGFDGIEIFENDFVAFDGTPGDVGWMVRDAVSHRCPETASSANGHAQNLKRLSSSR